MTNTIILVAKKDEAEEILDSYSSMGFIVSRDKNYLYDKNKNIIFYDEKNLDSYFRVEEIYNRLSYDSENSILLAERNLKHTILDEGWNSILEWR